MFKKYTPDQLNKLFDNILCISEFSENYKYNQMLKWKCLKCQNEFCRSLRCQLSAIDKCKFCKTNNNTKRTILDINKQFENIGVICVSKEYYGNKAKLKWKCLKCGDEFEKNLNSQIRKIIKCKNCYCLEAFNKIQEISKSYNGECIDKNFFGTKYKLTFKCEYGHIFNKKYTDVVNLGYWCPVCSRNNNLSEEICRTYFEHFFEKQFPTVRLNSLRSKKGYKLELDGYCEELNLAFEHQGTHHYENNKFNRLEYTKENDKLKLEQCNKLGINLIIIPTLFNKLSFPKLKYFIFNSCKDFGYNIDINKKIDLSKVRKNKMFEKVKEIAEAKGAKCLSNIYLGMKQKLEWECKNGHKWFTSPSVIKKGHLCPQCAHNKRKGRKGNKNEIKYHNPCL